MRRNKMTNKLERDMDYDWRIYMQAEVWQHRFKALTPQSPDREWMWIIKWFNGDQDDLDNLFNEYGKHGDD